MLWIKTFIKIKRSIKKRQGDGNNLLLKHSYFLRECFRVQRNHDIHNSLCESNSLVDKYKRRNTHLGDKLNVLKRKLHSSMNEVKKDESCFDGQECLSYACLFVHTALKVFNSCLWYLKENLVLYPIQNTQRKQHLWIYFIHD